MNRKIIISTLIIAVVRASGYAASRALFTDTEGTNDSSFTVGTLDMDVDGENGTEFERFDVTNIGADGTVNGGKTWTVNNTGSLPGKLTFSLASLENQENGCNEPEALADTTCDDPGPDQGELGNAIATIVTLDDAQVVSSNLATVNQDVYATDWVANAGVVTIPAGGSVVVKMNWSTDPQAYGNEIQSDSLSFDVAFNLEQVTPTP